MRKIRIKNTLLLPQTDSFVICLNSNQEFLTIPKSMVFSAVEMNFYSRTNHSSKEPWTILLVDLDFFRETSVLAKLGILKKKGHLAVFEKELFGINWDAVMDILFARENSFQKCFYCQATLLKVKTKDHVIPKAFLRAYDMNELEDNTVPCCLECNSEKANLHPYTFRERVKNILKKTKGPVFDKWSRVMAVLDKILLKSNDVFQ